MKTLVIADIHNRVEQAQHLLDNIPHDTVVFLGDYFDQFGDNANDAGIVARFLKEHTKNPKYTFLFGNHDIWYAFPWDELWCPGNTHEKRRMVRSILDPEDWNSIKLAHHEQGWWFSHAGLSPRYFIHPIKGFTKEGVEKRCLSALEDMKRRLLDPIFLAGMDRGGSVHVPFGSILWTDWSCFEPIENIKQVVGHTGRPEVRNNGDNYCLDTHSNHYAVIEDGVISIHKNEFTKSH